MKNKLLFCYYLLIACIPLSAQTSLTSTASLLQMEQQSLMFKTDLAVNQYNYQSWKKGMAKEKRKTMIKSTLAGLFIGALIGSSIDGLTRGSEKIISTLAAPVIGQEPCPSPRYTGTIISGSIGLLIGLGVGQEKAKKKKIKPLY